MRITATLLTYGEDSSPDMWGDVVTFAPDSLYLPDDQRVPLMVEHYRAMTAAGVMVEAYTEGDRVVGVFDLLDTDTGRAAALELAADVRRDVSVGVYFDPDGYTVEPLDPSDDSWLAPMRVTVSSADLAETSLCLRGRMPSARVESIETEGTPA